MALLTDPEWLQPQKAGQAFALPAAFYTMPSVLEIERRHVLAASWQLLANSDQLAGIGDHVVGEIGNMPVIVVRDEAGQLRAFHNVCRHRAGPLAQCNGRGASRLVCRYHGWTYNLDGSLRGAPEMQDAQNFSVKDIRLPEIEVAEWQGLVFAAAGDAAAFETVVDGIDERLGERRLDKLAFSQRVSYEIACNWKVYVDNFLEGYHLPMVHPELNRLLDYRSYVTETSAWHSLQWSPLETGNSLYGSGDALYYFIYPNTMLNILPDRLQTNRVLPLAVDRCRVEFDYYYPRASNDDRRQQDLDFSEAVQQEDIAICEAVQRGLASGSWHSGRLNPKRESGVHHFHELLRATFRKAG